MDEMQTLGIALGLGVFGILLLIIFIKSNIVLCQPNELVIVAGRRRKKGDGSLGYRVIRGGGWYYYAYNCRVAGRLINTPGNSDGHVGFRAVLPVQ